ncbi:hypothetical protein FJ251_01890 [bacterium]|nr:hypothetical protein [bacterium]
MASVRRRWRSVEPLLLAVAIALAGCSAEYDDVPLANRAPIIHLSSGPLEGEPDANYRVHFYWNGHDPDGRVDRYQFLITDDEITGSLLIDEDIYARLAALGYEWQDVWAHDSIFSVTADSIPDPASNPADSIYLYGDRFLFRAQHTFFIRAVDEAGLWSRLPEHRSFTATNIAPEVKIVFPLDLGGVGGYDGLPPDIFFRWTGNDSVGNGTVIEPDSTRFALLLRGDLGLNNQQSGLLLEFPPALWSPWRHWNEVDSLNPAIGGRQALVEDLTPVSQGGNAGYYLFFVQAKDEAGAITSHFQDGKNLRKLRIVGSLQPRLVIREASLGTNVSSHDMTWDYSIAADQPLNLTWSASAGEYGSEITGYRYGWDILDVSNDEEWSSWSLGNTATAASFPSGTHSFTLEARDYSGRATRIVYRFVVVPFTMDYDLLLVDDYDNTPVANPYQGWPLGPPFTWGTFPHDNAQQLAWWEAILGEYPDFVVGRDFFRVTIVDRAPYIQVLAAYRRVIWEVREGEPGASGLARIAAMIDPYTVQGAVPFDYVSAFLERGGQLLLCGVYPVFAMLPLPSQMQTGNYERKSPLAFLKHLGYSGGSVNESTAAVQRFLPWRHLGLDAVTKAVDPNPRYYPGANVDLRNTRTFWGLTGLGYAGEEQADYPISTGWVPPDTLRFRPEVYAWFAAAGPIFNNPDDWEDPSGANHVEFGIGEGEIYNWERFAAAYEPPLVLRSGQYRRLLNYIPADSTTRWGTAPSASHPFLRSDGTHYNEAHYSLGPNRPQMNGLVSVVHPETPSVVLGFTPYFLAPADARGLFDHILVDIFHLTKR